DQYPLKPHLFRRVDQSPATLPDDSASVPALQSIDRLLCSSQSMAQLLSRCSLVVLLLSQGFEASPFRKTEIEVRERFERLHERGGRLPFHSNRSGVLIIYMTSGDGPFLARPGSVTQKPLQYFAGAALRQLGLRKLDAARNFEIGERSSAIRDQLFRRKSFPRLEDNDRLYDFAPFRIRYPENRHFTNCRMRVNDGFDFAGVNVLPAGND